MPKKDKNDKCTKRVVFYITPREWNRANKIRSRFAQIRGVNTYACSALFVQMAIDESSQAGCVPTRTPTLR